MQAGVLVVGSANLDLVFQTARFPAPGETLLGGRFTTHPGGKGANQAVAAARLGTETHFCGCLGADAAGDTLRQSLAGAGVHLECVAVSERSATGTAGILVDATAANMIVVAPGSNADLDAGHVRETVRRLKPKVTLAQLEIPMEAVTAAAMDSERFILNPAPAGDIAEEVLRRCFAITPNETELALLTNRPTEEMAEVEEAAESLRQRGPEHVIVTLGSRGCLWCGPQGHRVFHAYLVRAVDTTAAGDAFNGALAAALAQDWPLDRAIPWANAVAALSVTRIGAQESMPVAPEVDAFLRDRA